MVGRLTRDGLVEKETREEDWRNQGGRWEVQPKKYVCNSDEIRAYDGEDYFICLLPDDYK